MPFIECDVCGRQEERSRLLPVDGLDVCELCATEKAWFHVVRDEKESENKEDKEDVLIVLMEHSTFTEKNLQLKAYETAVRAISQVAPYVPGSRVPIDLIEVFYKYKRDLRNEVLPVLKKAHLISEFNRDGEYVVPGPALQEIMDHFAANETDIGVKKLDGWISLAALSEESPRSRIRRVILDALKEDCIKENGEIKGSELRESTLQSVAERHGVSPKQMLNQLLQMLKYDFFFDGKNTKRVQGADGKIKRIWIVKKPWVRVSAKVLKRLREYELERLRERRRG